MSNQLRKTGARGRAAGAKLVALRPRLCFVFSHSSTVHLTMKLAASLALLATALAVTGCNTLVGVDNPDSREATFSNVTGSLVTKYNTADINAVFNAVKRAIDSQSDMKRMGETPDPENAAPNELVGVVVYARAIGDLEIKVEIAKVEDPISKQVSTSVTVKYGAFGNLPQSQKLVSIISQNLRR
jgi:hypothetical protein